MTVVSAPVKAEGLKADVPLVPVIAHGVTASKAVLLEPAKPVHRHAPPTKPSAPLEDKDLIVVPIAGKTGARLLAEITITQSADICPKCDSPLLSSPLGKSQDLHCAKCGHHFPAPTSSEIIGVSQVSDDSQSLFAKAHEDAERAAPDGRSSKQVNAENDALRTQLHDKERDDVSKSAAEKDNIALRKRADVQDAAAAAAKAKPVAAGNAWGRVASFEAEPGTQTEIWASVGSLPVSEVAVRLSNPGNVDRFTSVAVLVSVLDHAADAS